MTVGTHVDGGRIPARGHESLELAARQPIGGHGIRPTQRHEQRGGVRGQRDRCRSEPDGGLAEGRDREGSDNSVAARVDDAHRVRVAVGYIESRALLVPGDARRMASDGNDFGHRTRHQIDARHASGLRDATGIDTHELRERVAALSRGAIAGARLRATEIGDIGDRSLRIHDGSHRQHTQRNGLQKRAAVGVEDRQRIVGRQRHDHDAVPGRVRATRHRG